MTTSPNRGARSNPFVWIGFLVVIGGLIAFGSQRTPTEGSSEDRLYAIADDLKCTACVGESVANSQASIAIKMRSEIRDQMDQGKTDDEIFDFFVQSYDQRVLLNPPATGIAGLVWIIPVVVVGAAVAGLGTAFARWRGEQDHDGVSLTEEDERLVRAALDDDRGHSASDVGTQKNSDT